MSSKTIVVAGFDPGTAQTGVAVLSCKHKTKPIVVFLDTWTNVSKQLLSQVVRDYSVQNVAIELPVARAPHALRQLVGTAEIAGYIRGFADSFDLCPIQFSSYDWRKLLIGNSNATDATVKIAAGRFVDLPKVTNCHERDALCVALAASIRIFSVRKHACNDRIHRTR